MDYTALLQTTLTSQGFDLVPQWNSFEPPYQPDQGWQLKMPDCDFGPDTLVLLHFQDFVTTRDQTVIELRAVEHYYKDRTRQVLVTHWPNSLQRHYSGPANLIQFNSHEYQIIQNLQNRWGELECLQNRDRSQVWMCLNGRICDHRQRTVQCLQGRPHGWASLGTDQPLDLWSYANYRGLENEDNFAKLLPIYANSWLNVVTETQYHTAPGIITEKTFFALLSAQVPLVIGYPGIVADCRALGFDMFDDILDLSYDHLPNDVRVEQALVRNQHVFSREFDYQPLWPRLRRQQQWILHEWILKHIADFEHAAELLAQRLLA